MEGLRGSFTTLPFVVAMLIAVAAMGTDVYVVNRDGMAIEHAQPWRSKMDGAVERVTSVSRALFAGFLSALRGHPIIANQLGEVKVDLLTFGAAGGNQVTVLAARHDELRQKLTALNGKVTSEGRPMTEAEREELKGLQAMIGSVKEQLEVAKSLAAEEKAQAEAIVADRAAKAALEAGNGDAAASAAAAKDVRFGKDNREEEAKQPGYFGRQLQAVLQFAAKGGWNHLAKDEQRVLGTMLDAENRSRVLGAATGMNTDIASDGGFLVGQERTNTILQRVYAQGEILSRVARLPIGPGFNGTTLPAIDETSRADNSRYGGIVSGWLGQGNSLTSGKPKFREINLKLRKVGAFLYATSEQIADAIMLEGWVNRYLPLELMFRAEDAVLNGLGGSQPQGAVKSGAVITVTRNTASRILYEDVQGMWLRMWAPSRKNAVWLVDQSCEGDLETLAIPIGTGGTLAPIYKPAGSTPGQVYATLYGRPVIPVEYCAALGTSGDIVLVDLNEYLLVDKGGVQSAVSMHVAFLTDEDVFRFIYRVDGQLTWNSALTPKSGGNTLSCIVVLS